MQDVDKCIRCVVLARSFMGKTLDVIVKLYAESQVFRDMWDEAYNNLLEREAGRLQFDTEFHVGALRRVGVSMEMLFWFLRHAEFLRELRLEPKQLGLPIVSMTCELGVRELSGTLVRPTPGEPLHLYRNVKFWSDKVVLLQEDVMRPDKRLRKEEPMDSFKHLNKTNMNKHPKARWGGGRGLVLF